MSARKIAALVILVLWAGALGWYAKRLYLQPEARRLAAAARTIPPGPAYYAVYQGGRQTGWAQSEIDTLPSGGGFLVRDRLNMSLAGFGLTDTMTVRSRARLGPALALETFSLEARGGVASLAAEGEVSGDSLLEFRVVRQGDTVRRRVSLQRPILLATAVPLRLAAEGGGQPGERFEVETFDPTSMSSRTVTMVILDRKLMSFADSADRDTVSGAWYVAGRDTVDAWKLGREEDPSQLAAWVDEDGRFLLLETPGGLRLERTAFEVAFYGWNPTGARTDRETRTVTPAVIDSSRGPTGVREVSQGPSRGNRP